MKYFIFGIISTAISIVSIFVFYNYFPVGGIDLIQNEAGAMLGSTITTIAGTDSLSNSRAVINTNFSNLNNDKIEISTTTLPLLTTLTNLATANSLTINSTQLGVASTTPWGVLSVEQATETYSFVVGNYGSSTPSLIVRGVNGNGRVGVASSTPFAQFSVGDGGSATSSISTGKFCLYAGQENGVSVYVRLNASAANNQPFATSTTSCF